MYDKDEVDWDTVADIVVWGCEDIEYIQIVFE